MKKAGTSVDTQTGRKAARDPLTAPETASQPEPPAKGDRVRITAGQWTGHTGTVTDTWKSGAISVRIDRYGYRRTFYAHEIEALT